jgi:hypothetical protein
LFWDFHFSFLLFRIKTYENRLNPVVEKAPEILLKQTGGQKNPIPVPWWVIADEPFLDNGTR